LKRLLVAIVLAVLATGCTGNEAGGPATGSPDKTPVAAPTVTPSPVVLKPGQYTFENANDAVGTMRMPGTPDPEVEKLRALVGGEPPTYIGVTVDNQKGTEDVGMRGVSIFTADGQELKYENANTYVDQMRPPGAQAEVYNVFIKLANKLKAQAKPGTVRDFVLVGPPVPEVFSSVKVHLSGMADPLDAVPAGGPL
jgi:hypothetical protein